MELFIVFLYKLKGKSEPERAEKDNKKLDFYLVYHIVININLNILEKKQRKSIFIAQTIERITKVEKDLHECSDIVTFVFQDERHNPVKSESQVYIDTSTNRYQSWIRSIGHGYRRSPDNSFHHCDIERLTYVYNYDPLSRKWYYYLSITNHL